MPAASDIDAILAGMKEGPKDSQQSLEEVSRTALHVTIDSLSSYEPGELQTLYDNFMGEIINRGLEEEITGDVPDASMINLDEELNEMIKLVRKMRNNLNKQNILGKGASNREIRETLTACATVMKQIVSHQKTVRTFERQRVLENTLIEVLGGMGPTLAEEFQTLFRERLEELSE